MQIRYSILFLFISFSTLAQRKVEKLNRGLIAMRTNTSQVYLSWRLLGTESTETSFNLYRNGKKINTSPISKTTDFVDNTPENGQYFTRSMVNNIEQSASEEAAVYPNLFIEIPLKIPEGGTTPDGVTYTYNANDCSVGDVDGDGEYEIFVKWDPSNAKDNSQSGYTGNVYIDAYKMNGTFLWRIDLGKNIRAGAHYTQFLVYDFDSDGKAEMICKTADGTKDGLGKIMGDEKADYRTTTGYVLSGPEFLTVFKGQTGEIMATTDYLPARGNVADWGDNYGNRVDRYIAAVGYLDGKMPSAVFGRGYYTRLVRVAWDWRAGKLTQRWIFDSNNNQKDYEYQGNHQMTVGDVDNDGKDEIINGASCIDDDGKGYYANQLGHGDALHMTDMNPDIEGQEIWQCHESPGKYGAYGLEFRDAKTGKSLWAVDGENKDVGRCMAGDIDPRHKGYELWGAVGGLYNVKGEKISDTRPNSMNFGIWWDADLSRELLDGNHIDKWDYQNNKLNRIFTATECTSNNGTKATPCLSGDILGDWREEVILRTTDNKALRIFMTTIPAENKLFTLMHDTQYRVAIAWQNSAYNQPPHPSFYLGTDMKMPAQPKIETVASVSILQNEEDKNEETFIFPNPTNHSFSVKLAGKFTIQIVDLQGNILEKESCLDKCEIGKTLPTGIFLVNIFKQYKKVQSYKILKNN